MEFIIFFRIQVLKSDENYVKIVIRDQNIYVNGLRVNKIVDCLKIWKVLLIDILTIHLTHLLKKLVLIYSLQG